MFDTEKINNFINEFDPANKGNVIVFAILFCALLVAIYKAINNTFIEEFFIDSKKKNRNSFFKLVGLLAILVLANFILSINYTYFILEFFMASIGLVLYLVYKIKERSTEKYKKKLNEKYNESINGLNRYYKEKRSSSFLFCIIAMMPVCSIFMNLLMNSIPLFNCAVIVSVIELSIICFSLSNIIKRESKIYFLLDNKKMYIYEMIDSNNVICGDSVKISEAEKYRIISIFYMEKIYFY